MERTRDTYVDYPSSSESGRLHRSELPPKVSTPEEGSEDDNDSPQPPLLQRKHFCVICNKQFSSGKAYGGHVRIHSIEYSNNGKMKKKKKKKKSKSGLVKEKGKEKEIDLIKADVEGKIRCCLCGKVFQTMNSLFGHMRRHPDRTWKGIRPPSPPEKFKLSYLSDDDDDDYDDVMSRPKMMSDVTEDVHQAACILMMLFYKSRSIWEGRNTAMVPPKSEVRSSSCNKDDSAKDDGGLDDMKTEMEIEMNVNKPQDNAESSLGFDLNQPYHEDHH